MTAYRSGRSLGSRSAISIVTRSTPPISRRAAARASMTTGASRRLTETFRLSRAAALSKAA
jgi:hypothetical protein